MIDGECVGVVLSGGMSSRMGRDKALLKYEGQTLLALSDKRLHELGCYTVLVSCNHGGGIPDLLPNIGPIGGLHAVVNYMLSNSVTASWLVITPVDMPLLKKENLEALFQQAKHVQSSVFFNESPLPCIIPYSSELADTLDRLLASDEKKSVKNLLRTLNAKAINCPTPQNMINTNTPEEWGAVVESRMVDSH